MERVIGYTESFFLSAMQFFGPDEDGLCFNLTDNYDSDRPFVCTVIDYGEGIILDAA